MANQEQEIPYGNVRIKCRSCNAQYFVDTRVLKRKTECNSGFFPCEKCGSHSTEWEFRAAD